MNLVNLDEVRAHMVSEIQNDINSNLIYLSTRLTESGRALFPIALLEAAKNTNVLELVIAFGIQNFNTHFQRSKPNGGYSSVIMPNTANSTLCEGEFNRYYIRGVCLKAIELGKETVTVYRARNSTNPRSESLLIEGKIIDAKHLLEVLTLDASPPFYLRLILE